MSNFEIALGFSWGEGEDYERASVSHEGENIWIYKYGTDPEEAGDPVVNLDPESCADLVNFMIREGVIKANDLHFEPSYDQE